MSARRGVFCKRLEAAIEDEAGAKKEYDRLLNVAPRGTASTIKGIQRDEKGHRKRLLKLQDKHCK